MRAAGLIERHARIDAVATSNPLATTVPAAWNADHAASVGGQASEYRSWRCADRPRGSVVTGLTNGDVVRVSADGAVVLGNTGGRPLGIEEYPDGNLLVCDHDRGLLRLDVATGEVQVLLDEVDGKHLHFCSNAVICADGTIYFSSSSDTATNRHHATSH
jgi:sugar lactone lactonase YvrE